MHDTIPADLLAAIRDQRLREQAATMRLAPNHWETAPPTASVDARGRDLFTRWLAGVERLGYKVRPKSRVLVEDPHVKRMPTYGTELIAGMGVSPARVARGAVPSPMQPETLRRIAEGLRRYEAVEQRSAPWIGVQAGDILAAQKFG